ncbi:MAG: putative holin, partial [Klebsiella michiganensis]|nr:putative holin [Klebsiella michiganensis]
MSDPVSGTSIIVAGGLMGAGMFGLVTGIDYGVVFGAFAGAVFYVATAVNITRFREGANKQVISSQADSLIKISRIWADFFPANTS